MSMAMTMKRKTQARTQTKRKLLRLLQADATQPVPAAQLLAGLQEAEAVVAEEAPPLQAEEVCFESCRDPS